MATENLESVWNLDENSYVMDESTALREVLEFKSPQGNDLAGVDRIKLQLTDDSQYFKLDESFITLDFQVYKTTDAVPEVTEITENDMVSIQDGWNLMDNVKLSINNEMLDSVKNPGVQHHMTALSEYAKDYKNIADKGAFYPMDVNDVDGDESYTDPDAARFLSVSDTFIFNGSTERRSPHNSHITPVKKGYLYDSGDSGVGTTFLYENEQYSEDYMKSVKHVANVKQVTLPLREIFGSLTALNRVCRGSKMEIELTKNAAERCFYVFGTVAAGFSLSFDITKASLWCTAYTPSLESQLRVESILAKEGESNHNYIHRELFTRSNIPSATTNNRIRVDVPSSKVTAVHFALQLDESNESVRRASNQFEPLNLSHLQVVVNGQTVPKNSYQVSNGKSRLLSDVVDLNDKSGDYESGMIITRETFENGPHTVYHIDMTQARVGEGMSQIEIRYSLSSPVTESKHALADPYALETTPKSYTARVLVSSIRTLEIKNRSGKMKVMPKE